MICETCDGEREVWLPDEMDGGRHYSSPCPHCVVAVEADTRAKVEAETVAKICAWVRGPDAYENGIHEAMVKRMVRGEWKKS